LDTLAPGLMAGAALGWIGCHLAGVAYGRPVFPGDRWWFLAADLPDIYRLWDPRIATQLLGAAWAALCFVVAMTNHRCSSPVARLSTFAVTMALYSAGMFALGFARGDVAPMAGAWRVDQVVDVAIAMAGIVYILASNIRREQ
jgi:prolipoprotein diacylglyceryltransferase